MPTWTADAEDYRRDASYVPRLTDALLASAGPLGGLRVLDLGCGEGSLTARLVDAGAVVQAVDADDSMVAATSARGIDARRADARTLDGVEGPFDLVVSNAVLHWVTAADEVAASVHRVLTPGGRYVAEAGGHGNVAAVRVALRAALDATGHHAVAVPSWWFPTVAQQRAVLEGAGLVVEDVALVPRPTALGGDAATWLRTFCGDSLAAVGADADRVVDHAVGLLAPVLCDDQGAWTADYVRIRFAAHRPATTAG